MIDSRTKIDIILFDTAWKYVTLLRCYNRSISNNECDHLHIFPLYRFNIICTYIAGSRRIRPTARPETRNKIVHEKSLVPTPTVFGVRYNFIAFTE